MAVITTFDVVDCNRALAEAGFSGSVHLHDACGAQSLSWDESLDSGPEPVGAVAGAVLLVPWHGGACDGGTAPRGGSLTASGAAPR